VDLLPEADFLYVTIPELKVEQTMTWREDI